MRVEADEERQVGVGAHVVVEERGTPLHEVLGEDHVPHRHGEGGVGAGLGGHPLVGELGVVGVVRADRDDLGAAVADLGHPVGVRRPRHGDVGPPHHQVGRVPPVPGLGDVGLVAEHLGAGDGQVGVPVVERRHDAADQLDEPGADAVRHHRHRRNRGEAGDAVGAVGLDGVDMRGGGDLDRLGPGRADQPSLAAGLLVAATLLPVAGDLGPGEHRVTEPRPRLAVHLEQHTAHVRVAHPGRRVGVPGEGRTARAAPGLVLGTVRAHRRVVGLLRLPRDDPVLDVHLPRAGPGAVHSVRRADHLVVAPPVPVEDVAGAPTLAEDGPPVVGLVPPREEPSRLEQRGRGRPVDPRSDAVWHT